MRFGARAVGSSCYQVFSHLASSSGGNVLAMVLSLPIVLLSIVAAFALDSLDLVPLCIAVFAGALPNPACMGLQTLARELAHGDSASFGEQWQALRRYWRVSLRAWLVAAAITITCVVNMAFYASQASSPTARFHTVGTPLFVVWTLILILWLGVHLYVAPLLLAQTEPRVLLAYRNAAVTMLSRPVASLTVALVWLGALVFTSATALAAVIGLALAASIQQNALRLSLPGLLPAAGEVDVPAIHAPETR